MLANFTLNKIGYSSIAIIGKRLIRKDLIISIVLLLGSLEPNNKIIIN